MDICLAKTPLYSIIYIKAKENTMEKFCTVPTGFNLTSEGNTCYALCGLPATYEVGCWFVCEGHKRHYCDPNKWVGKSLKGEVEDGRAA